VNTEPKTTESRILAYTRQNKSEKLTVRQERAIRRAEGKALGRARREAAKNDSEA
jgi:hypothetical protein